MASRAGAHARGPPRPSPRAARRPQLSAPLRPSRARPARRGYADARRRAPPHRVRRAARPPPADGAGDRSWRRPRGQAGLGRVAGDRFGDGHNQDALPVGGRAAQIRGAAHPHEVLGPGREHRHRLHDEPVIGDGPPAQQLAQAGGRWAGGGAPGRAAVSRRAVVSRRRLSESARARTRAWIESNRAGVYTARTATGVVSGSANTRTAAVSGARRGSSGAEKAIRSVTESTGSTVRTRGPSVSCTKGQRSTCALESTVTVTVSNASRRSWWRLLF